MNTLVIYFSQTGVTKKAAQRIAKIKGSDLIEIKPEKPYNMSYWKTVFTSLKEIFTKARPELSMEIPDVLQYDRIMLGCPIWCGVVPNVVLTLLDAVDITGKHIALFTTSGASKPDHLAVKLKKSYPKARWHRPLNANNMTDDDIADWM